MRHSFNLIDAALPDRSMKDGDMFERELFWLLVVVCEDHWLGGERVEESRGKRVLSVVGHRARCTIDSVTGCDSLSYCHNCDPFRRTSWC